MGTIVGELPGPNTSLRGDYALVRRCDGCLQLARARFGGRPLYWLRLESVTVASDRLLPLAILGRTELELDLDHVFALFDARLIVWRNPPPFLGVQRVRTNTIVEIGRSGATRVSPGPIHIGSELRLSAGGLASALRDEFLAAVERECAGVRRVAVMTGGGVDSSNILAAAVGNHRRWGTAAVVPLAFDYGGPGDERPQLRALCQHLDVTPSASLRPRVRPT